MGFEGLAPSWLSRLLADGALATVYVLPSIVALAVYAWVSFLAVDALISVIDKAFAMTSFSTALSSTRLGSASARLRIQLGRIPGWILKVWIGLPMFGIAQLAISRDP